MAATVHSDRYGIFLRKIGYSVGLEFTLKRVNFLTSRYLKNRDISLATWRELVLGDEKEGNFGRKQESAIKNMADFFSSLQLIQRTEGDILVLENLDAIAIATESLSDLEKRLIAQDFIFLWAILVNDGEIFVNFLLSDFEETRIQGTLSKMIIYKRHTLIKAMPGKDIEKIVSRVVNIERQKKNKGGAGLGQSIESLRRTEPLEGSKKISSNSSVDEIIDISDDYLKKVSQTRKDWAKSLGLWSNETGLTELGKHFKETLISLKYIIDGEFFVFQPMDFELIRSGFKENLLGETKSLWETLIDFGQAYSRRDVKNFEHPDSNELVSQLDSMMRIYRSLHVRKSMLRREMAITVAFPAIVAIACAKREPIIDVPATLDFEQKGGQRRIVFRRSRNTGGALSVRR